MFLLGVLIWISAIDLRRFRIPNALNALLVAGGLLDAALVTGDVAPRLVGAGAGYLVLALWGEIYFRIRKREGLGLGDAKLFAGAGAWLGWQALPHVLLLAALSGLAWAVATGARGDTRIAFGPFMALALFGIWVHARVIAA